MKFNTPTRAISIGLLVCGALSAQGEIRGETGSTAPPPAIAIPVTGIIVDGDLGDWPAEAIAYSIENTVFGVIEFPEDLKGVFRVAYNSVGNDLYIGLTVTDSESISESATNVIEEIDHVMLYVDGVHAATGGSSQLRMAGGNLREIGNEFSRAWNPYMPRTSWGDVELSLRRTGLQTHYEWRIGIERDLRPGVAIGLDLILADVDPGDEDSSWLAWKPGTSKSQGSQRLGDVLMIGHSNDLGEVRGSATAESDLIPAMEYVRFTSVRDPALWFRLPVDSLGQYVGTVPAGHYELVPEQVMTSIVDDSGFGLAPLRTRVLAPVFVDVRPGELVEAEPLRSVVALAPSGLFQAKGLLIQPNFREVEVDQFVRAFQDYYGIPGISLALIHNRHIVYDKVFGVKNQLTQEPMTLDTLFEAASISKPVFALMVLELAAEGRIDLDRPLLQYLPFPNIEHDERAQHITARHVLNHQTGLTNWPLGSYTGFLPDTPVDLLFEPGARFEYSGEAFNYLGRVVVEILGQPLSDHFRDGLASDLGLLSTRYGYTSDLASEVAMGHWHSFPRFKGKHDGIDSPASSLHSNAHEFSRVLLELMEPSFLSEATQKLVAEPYQALEEEQKLYNPKQPQALAHGFFLSETERGLTLAHGGNNGDFESKFALMPEQGVGYVVFTNNNLGDEFIRLLELFLLDGEAKYRSEFPYH